MKDLFLAFIIVPIIVGMMWFSKYCTPERIESFDKFVDSKYGHVQSSSLKKEKEVGEE